MAIRRAHAAAAILFIAAILYQVFLAGTAIANLGGSSDFTAHIGFGYTGVFVAWLFLILSALAARRPRREIGFVLLILLDYVIQTTLPAAKASTPWVAALHPVNALVLFGLAAWYARRAWAAATA